LAPQPTFDAAGNWPLADAGTGTNACAPAAAIAVSPNDGAAQATKWNPMMHPRALQSRGCACCSAIAESLFQITNLLYAKSKCTYEAAPSRL
jgi:hypothetical protein